MTLVQHFYTFYVHLYNYYNMHLEGVLIIVQRQQSSLALEQSLLSPFSHT